MITRFILVAFGFLTYLIQPDDIVWILVRDSQHPRTFERLLFALAAVLMGGAALIRTQGRVDPNAKRIVGSGPLGELIFTIGLAFFAPISGFLILVVGESVIFVMRTRQKASPVRSSSWLEAVKTESGKWGLFVTTIIFVATLNDRVAESVAGLSVVVWVLLNFQSSWKISSDKRNFLNSDS
jgi:hypothetical protein